jgi:IS30 family transposase
MIERDLNIPVYFARPHHPWQRGKNENTNGRIRRIFPKRFNFSTLSQGQLDAVVHIMNHTPRKSLSWRTPADVFREVRCVSD